MLEPEVKYSRQYRFNRKSQLTNPKRWILYRARQRAKRKGLECTLTLDDIPDTPEYCPVFPWIKLEKGAGKGRGFKAPIPSLDRINPLDGYHKDNIRIISWRANTMRSDGGIREFEALITDAKRLGRG
jgi:hypothetical protein